MRSSSFLQVFTSLDLEWKNQKNFTYGESLNKKRDIWFAAEIYSWLTAALWFAVLLFDLANLRLYSGSIDVVMIVQLLAVFRLARRDQLSISTATHINAATSYAAIILSTLLKGGARPGVPWFFLLLPMASVTFVSRLSAAVWGLLACLGPPIAWWCNSHIAFPKEAEPPDWEYFCSQIVVTLGATVYAVVACKILRDQADALKHSRDQALSLSQTKDRFLATVSHEMRNPMNGILGALSLLRDDSIELAERKSLLDALEQGGQQLLTLVNDILDFSSLDGGHLKLHPVSFDPRRLTEDVASVFRSRALQKSLEFHCHTGDAPWPPRLGDPVRIGQILSNLIANAIRFTDKGRVEVQLGSLGRNLIWSIHDTGCGIEAVDFELIFQPFKQADLSDARRAQGTGLGLAISQALAQKMGGLITVRSHVSAGSVFELSLPLEFSRESLASVEAPSPQQRPPTLRILLIDDSLINQRVFAAMLRRLGSHCSTCCSGDEALLRPDLQHYQLILCDLHMPGLDGWETIRQLRLMSIEVPIFALTADTLEESRLHALEVGADLVLHKPLQIEELSGAIVSAFGGA